MTVLVFKIIIIQFQFTSQNLELMRIAVMCCGLIIISWFVFLAVSCLYNLLNILKPFLFAFIMQNFYKTTLCLAYQSLGVVYGDLSTSPIYVYKSTFSGHLQLYEEDDEILGVLSLVFWSLTLIPLCKYIIFVLGAGENGEGVCSHWPFYYPLEFWGYVLVIVLSEIKLCL